MRPLPPSHIIQAARLLGATHINWAPKADITWFCYGSKDDWVDIARWSPGIGLRRWPFGGSHAEARGYIYEVIEDSGVQND